MLNIIKIMIIILFAIIAILLIATIINHKIKLKKETKKYFPSGDMLEVNGKKLRVHFEGQGSFTLVFMSGHGTFNPTLDFKPMWMRMIDEYKIAVVEKSGYGWSDVSNSSKDVDTMLEETRKALKLSGEKGPYILVPHSMSGLEAIYWAQKYPDEVKAIIGLDPCVPDAVDILPEPNKIQLYIMYIISKMGIPRYMPDTEINKNFPLMNSEDLTKEEKQKYLSAFYKSGFSKDMLREVNYLKQNAKTVRSHEAPVNVPMYFFISEGQDTIVNGWKKVLSDYISKVKDGRYTNLDTGHYIHYHKSDIIVPEIKKFLNEIKILQR